MGKYFGTDGFRGEANVNLTVEHAYQVGRFLGWYYGKAKEEKCKVVIGKDTRRSSYMFEYYLVAGQMCISDRAQTEDLAEEHHEEDGFLSDEDAIILQEPEKKKFSKKKLALICGCLLYTS